MITFQEWQKIELRIAKILGVDEIPGKDKLYRLLIDLGSERRQIIAGLKQYYKKEELQGKNIVVVANLQPATIAGLESQAMLLAAKDSKGSYKIVTVDESVPPGTKAE
ncbi:MAG: methionine--tRNA ligase subunit beta [Candidatus Diapherotrites archaeon]|nr:methionine--tRNA ligase subunit beta [Candidatus Diapherotrites archaeon]